MCTCGGSGDRSGQDPGTPAAGCTWGRVSWGRRGADGLSGDAASVLKEEGRREGAAVGSIPRASDPGCRSGGPQVAFGVQSLLTRAPNPPKAVTLTGVVYDGRKDAGRGQPGAAPGRFHARSPGLSPPGGVTDGVSSLVAHPRPGSRCPPRAWACGVCAGLHPRGAAAHPWVWPSVSHCLWVQWILCGPKPHHKSNPITLLEELTWPKVPGKQGQDIPRARGPPPRS